MHPNFNSLSPQCSQKRNWNMISQNLKGWNWQFEPSYFESGWYQFFFIHIHKKSWESKIEAFFAQLYSHIGDYIPMSIPIDRWCPHIISYCLYGGFLSHGGTPSSHPSHSKFNHDSALSPNHGDFHGDDWGSPMTSEAAPYLGKLGMGQVIGSQVICFFLSLKFWPIPIYILYINTYKP